MKLSIYIPALERDALFDRCLRSIRRSIAAAGSDAFAANDYEIVVVDGISPVAAARNEALRRMSGEWITCVDADDEVTGGWFREICRAIAAAERNGGIDDIVFDMTVVHGTGETELQYGRESVVETATLVDDMLRDMRLGGHAVRHVMRRSLWADDRFELLPALEDYVTLPRVLARARKIAYIAKPLYRYIVRPGSLSNGSAESRCAAFVTAVYQAESFGGAANIGTMVCAYNLLYDRIGMNGAARRWIRHHLLQALCDFEVPIKWKVKFALAALGVIVRRPCVIKWIREVGFFCGPTLVCFGALFLADAVEGFGYDGTTAGYLHPLLNLLRNTVTYTLLVASFVYFLGRAARWVLVPAFAWSLVCTALCVYTAHVYHVPLCDVWLQAVRDASWEEIVQTIALNMTPGVVAGAVVLAALSAVYAVLMCRRPPVLLPWRRRFVLGFALAVPFLVLNGLCMYRFKGFAQMRVTGFPIGTYLNWRDHRGAQRAFANGGLPDRIPSAVPFGELPDLMIVIGESSTRTHWHLYGYDRDTTPRMDARAARGEIAVLQGVTCAKPNTGPALEHLLTDCEAAHPEKGSWTLPELLRRVGYRTRLVSNQRDLPRQDCYQVFNGCERRCYLHEILPPGRTRYDEQVLPYVAAAFDGTNDAPTAVFVHLQGLHYPVQGCYPPTAAHFPGTDRADRYDNATRYQDRILDELLKIAAKRRKWLFLYVSDHGETPSSSVWRDFRDPDAYAIPAIVAPAHAGLPDNLRQDELTELILGLAGIRATEKK